MSKVIGDQVEIAEDAVRCRSIVEIIWEVKNFTKLEINKTIHSPIFHGEKCAEKWRLSVELFKKAEDTEKHVDIGLYLIESVEAVKVQYQINFLNSQNKVVSEGEFVTFEFLVGDADVTRDLYQGYVDTPWLFNSSLRLHCQVITQTSRNLKQQRDDEECSVKKQLRSFLTNGDFADVILKTENTSFPASKLILAAHSPVFSAMFSSGMLESAENVVKIEDCSDEAVRGFLDFLYTGETQVLEENPVDLLKISDKYQVMELKKTAESVILRKLTIQNAVEMLILAHFHSPTTIKPTVIAIVNRNSKEIQQTPEFKEMASNFPSLLLDLYMQMTSVDKS